MMLRQVELPCPKLERYANRDQKRKHARSKCSVCGGKLTIVKNMALKVKVED